LDVVEDAPRAEGLPLAVALDVIREAESRRDLAAPAEFDAGILFAVGRDARRVETHAVVDRHLVVERPLILQEQADVARLDVADGVLLDDRVVTVRAAHRTLIERRPRLVPAERH